MFRMILFWSHLVAGISAGFFILLMSVTGVLLTYEKNMINGLRASATITAPPESQRLSLDELAEKARDLDRAGASLSFNKKRHAPILIQKRGAESILLNPYTGEQTADPSVKLAAFFKAVTSLHRWLGMTGESRKTGRTITGASNLIFLFIVVSGLYLWLPKIWRWSFIRLNLLFRRNLPTSKARDYNWHHVFGIWALIPLFFIVISGVVISYSWAGNLVYKAAGETPPQRRGPPRGVDNAKPVPGVENVILKVTLEDAFAQVSRQSDGKWSSARVDIPQTKNAPLASITLNYGSGVVAKSRISYRYDLQKSEIVNIDSSDDSSRGRKLRTWFRFIHTGEQYGFLGQTIAGLSTLAACFLVYTGLALSYRRLITPLLRRRKRKRQTSA